jgi:hypothetical protein
MHSGQAMALPWLGRSAVFMSGIAKNSEEEDLDDHTRRTAPAFVLELYPSEAQRGVAGRFIAEARGASCLQVTTGCLSL